jgi:hypothetical protein
MKPATELGALTKVALPFRPRRQYFCDAVFQPAAQGQFAIATSFAAVNTDDKVCPVSKPESACGGRATARRGPANIDWTMIQWNGRHVVHLHVVDCPLRP